MIHTLLALIAAAGVSTPSALPVDRPCRYEDSRHCVWDAKHMGNGGGKSFIATRDGKVIYISHRLAHRLLND